MLTIREVATIRAALRYWAEEMAPHSASFSSAYFDRTVDNPMSGDEIKRLIRRLNLDQLRYLRLETSSKAADSRLLKDSDLPNLADGDNIATVILPPASSNSGPIKDPS